ncbi:HprK-related kinase A [Nitrosomonas sp. Nm51]|uniref:HprK-related kinase A n=1 Tax=Nitrosomonas sp. Nm51 TaxID=133720 RepID=UPI0008D78F6F|nr:HprK-related kinase A [Nitrosomonas sp. Nm51]SER31250.1 HprK-related kinase A [Nitrosomonas sp. Nm51]
MMIKQIPYKEFHRLLLNQGLRVAIGPFNVCVQTAYAPLAEQLYKLYCHYRLVQDEIAEFHVRIVTERLYKNPFRQNVRFLLDGQSPFNSFPPEQALAVLEWGINLAIAVRVNHLLILHSAVVEKNGHAILFPAWPGSGKTTLCTVLCYRGFRLLSDEFGLMDPRRRLFLPIPRLMPLKNESIAVIRSYLPEIVMGQSIPNTQKGTVAHVRPPEQSLLQSEHTAKAKWIIFPKWIAGSPAKIEAISDSEAFMLLASNAFNYEVLGATGFMAVADLIRSCDCYKLVYSDFDNVMDVLHKLINEA